ncbi:MAG: thiamine phosphate synthase [Clostridiales bacterium]|nr:thiamine phosphate synthase [Clostridiales bacterium]
MKVKPETLRLYAVTDRAWLHGRTLESQMEQAILGGATIVQLREKTLTGEALLAEAKALRALCRRYGVPFLVNDDVALALAVGADGVHVGQEDMAAEQARALLGPDKILGVSAHSVAQAVAAQRAGADYLGCGAAFVTGTKTDARPIPRETLQAVTAAVNIPVVAIGGITQGNLPQLQGCSLAGAAVVSALFAQEDVQEAARELRRLAEQL